jgi:hypothetical protein
LATGRLQPQEGRVRTYGKRCLSATASSADASSRRDAVKNIACQIQQLPGMKHMALAFGRDLDRTLDALHDDLAGHPVWRERLAGDEYQAHDLEILALEESDRLLCSQLAAKGADVDGLTGLRVFDGHGNTSAQALPSGTTVR